MKYRKKPVVIDAIQFTDEMRAAIILDGAPCPAGVTRGSSSYNAVLSGKPPHTEL